MVTPGQMRKIALSLPETEERSHFAQPDFRVRDKIFAGLSRDEKRASMKLPLELQTMLVGAKPKAYSPAEGGWGRSGWTYVELSHVELDELRELVHEAWRTIAPRGLATSARAPSPRPRLAGPKSKAAAPKPRTAAKPRVSTKKAKVGAKRAKSRRT